MSNQEEHVNESDLNYIAEQRQKSVLEFVQNHFMDAINAVCQVATIDIGNIERLKETAKLVDLAYMMKDAREKLELFDEAKKMYQKIYDHLSMVTIPEKMDEEGIDNIKITGVGRLQCQSDIRCNVLAANRENLEQWLINNNHAAMVQTTINSSSLKAFVKERMKENLPYPTDLIKVEPYYRATIVKA